MPNRQILYYSATVSSYTAPHNEGPWNLPSINTLLAAHVRGSWSWGANNLGTGTPGDSVNWGLQLGPHGYTPYNVVTDDTYSHWLWTGEQDPGDVLAAWTPSTDAAAAITYVSNSERWNGQLPLGASTDFYLSWGYPFGYSGFTFHVQGTVELIYS